LVVRDNVQHDQFPQDVVGFVGRQRKFAVFSLPARIGSLAFVEAARPVGAYLRLRTNLCNQRWRYHLEATLHI
jgi:hypothetical protein